MGNKKLQKSTFQGMSFMQLLEWVFERCDQEEMQHFAGVARRLWLRRNDFIHEGELLHPRILMQQMEKAVSEFSLANVRDTQTQSSRVEDVPFHWSHYKKTHDF
jgi:hypothetical protein